MLSINNSDMSNNNRHEQFITLKNNKISNTDKAEKMFHSKQVERNSFCFDLVEKDLNIFPYTPAEVLGSTLCCKISVSVRSASLGNRRPTHLHQKAKINVMFCADPGHIYSEV